MATKKVVSKAVLPTVKGFRSFTDRNGHMWTKFVLSDGSAIMESGTFAPGKFILVEEKGEDGEKYLHVYQAC